MVLSRISDSVKIVKSDPETSYWGYGPGMFKVYTEVGFIARHLRRLKGVFPANRYFKSFSHKQPFAWDFVLLLEDFDQTLETLKNMSSSTFSPREENTDLPQAEKMGDVKGITLPRNKRP